MERDFKPVFFKCCKHLGRGWECPDHQWGVAKRICSSSLQTYRAHPGFWGNSQCPSPGAGSAGSSSQGCSSEFGQKLREEKRFIKLPDFRKGIRRGKKTMSVEIVWKRMIPLSRLIFFWITAHKNPSLHKNKVKISTVTYQTIIFNIEMSPLNSTISSNYSISIQIYGKNSNISNIIISNILLNLIQRLKTN